MTKRRFVWLALGRMTLFGQFFISNAGMYILRLEIYISRAEIDILHAEIYFCVQ